MKIFISYARVDKSFCNRIMDTLRQSHEVWCDQRLYAGQHWWEEILRRLDWCDVFVYLLSTDSVNSIYCRKELEVAQELNRHILPILIKKDTVLPDDLKNLHYMDMTDDLSVENVTGLLSSILMLERFEPPEERKTMKNSMKTEGPVNQSSDPAQIIYQGLKAMEEGDYDNAILLFEQAKANGFTSRFVDIDKLLALAKEKIAEKIRLQVAEDEYKYIFSLFKFETTREYACQIFEEFQREFPDYGDPEGLAHACKNPDAITDDEILEPLILDKEVLPMLQWCNIPYGVVEVARVESNGELFGQMTVKVDNFVMSRFPITNKQFARFAKEGYKNPKYWQFSDFAKTWHENNAEAGSPRFLGDERPRETVNWYEANAFCYWLSELMNMKITLPTVAQWQRAAQGDEDHFFPWGNHYHEDYCNTRESGIQMTTPVNRYDNGVSPYDVYDMAGNVWEWTLDIAEPNDESPDYRRAVIGGSFVSPYDRAQTSFRYYLNPKVQYASIGFRVVGLL